MHNLPLVSIMIPTYNQADYIGYAVRSALEQDYPNLEVIVSDDCSKDNTNKIIASFKHDSRLKYFRNESNLGRIGNYHHTLYNLTNGEWVINLDGDDFFTDPHFISRAMNRILKNSNVVCYFARKYISKKLKKYTDYEIEPNCYLIDGIEYLKNYYVYGGFSHAGTLFKKSVTLTDRLCYTFDGIQCDFHGIIRYSVLGKIIISYEDVFFWRLHGNNQTNSVSLKQKYINELKCQDAIMRDLPNFQFSSADRKEWLRKGNCNARAQYVKDCLNFSPSIHTLIIGIHNYQFSIPYTIMYIKSFLRLIGFKSIKV